ncbi:DUF6270 domain-containing protein [Isoptericola sp. NPDC019482]|uniref:DUF6270 domain-containing protein n=1 Tax=Isoptericola sp. NPDC019482 TaxID=3154688 RepID=UPI00348D807F
MSKNRVFIYGSCVSRDTFEHLDPTQFELLQYVARQSALSAYTRPVTLVGPPQLESPFQQRMVSGDYASSMQTLVPEVASQTDLVIVDLVDERLGAYVLPDGSVVTRSPELIQSGAEQHLPPGSQHFPFGSEQHFQYWSQGIAAVGALIRHHMPHAAIVLLDIPWAERSESGTPTPPSFGVTASEANPIFQPYVNVAADALSARVISMRPGAVTSSPDHPWGDAPFHYAERVYLEIVRRLTGQDGRNARPPAAEPDAPLELSDQPKTQSRPSRSPKAPSKTSSAESKGTDSLKLRANQVAAIHTTLRHQLPGKWHRHAIWSRGPASVHEFKLGDIVLAFDILVRNDEVDVQLVPKDRSHTESLIDLLKSHSITFKEAGLAKGRVSVWHARIPAGIVDDKFAQSLQNRIVSIRTSISEVSARPTGSRSGSHASLPRANPYDYGKFGPVFGANNGSLNIRSISDDGVYRLGTPSAPLDVLVTGISHLQQDNGPRVALVVLSGMVGDRSNLRGPFFSGAQVAKVSGITTISVSDPSLSLNNELRLGWYLGTKSRPELPIEIAQLIDGLGDLWGADIYFIGGSGGGFAALNIARHMNLGVGGLIVNPQTAVSNYSLEHVNTYLRTASGVHTQVRTAQEARAALDELGVLHDVTSATWSKDHFLIAQNETDWHVTAHLKPLMVKGTWERVDQRIHVDQARGLTVYMRDWGDGHAAFPSRSTIPELMRTVGPLQHPVLVARQLDHLLDQQALAAPRR